jgi:two-component system, NarL family, response regulator
MKILIIENETLVRIEIRTILDGISDFEIVGEAETSEEGFNLFKRTSPDITLMSLRLNETLAIDGLKSFINFAPKAKIIIIASQASDGEISKALKEGALGYILRNISAAELVKAIQTVASGKRFIPNEVAEASNEYYAHEALTKSEQAILQMIVGGMTNKEIAFALDISENTVKTHNKNLYEKLDVSDRTSAATSAIKRGLVRINL